jgi:hypothetical protein
MTPAESELQLTSRGITGVPPDTLSTVRTNAAVGATPAGQQYSLPLVVHSPGFTNPRSTLTALAGWKRWLVVAGAVHASFTDLALLADQAGIDIGADLPGAGSLDITRGYVRAFFDQHLRGSPQALLDQPSPRYPEVTFCSRGD